MYFVLGVERMLKNALVLQFHQKKKQQDLLRKRKEERLQVCNNKTVTSMFDSSTGMDFSVFVKFLHVLCRLLASSAEPDSFFLFDFFICRAFIFKNFRLL